jgi:hypothetical protein
MRSWFEMPAIVNGAVLGPSCYLYFATGAGVISLSAFVYPIILSQLSIVPAWMTTDRQGRYNWLSVLIGLTFMFIALFVSFIYAFLAGLPGSDWMGVDATHVLLAFPLIAALLCCMRTPSQCVAISFNVLIFFLLTLLSAQVVTRSLLASEIQSTQQSGGCVVVDGEKIKGAMDVPLGIFIGTRSPRIFFYSASTTMMWSYSAFQQVDAYQQKQVVEPVCSANKADGIGNPNNS